ncbi:hypothetical protein [Methylobacterium oxalidis]|uniref:Uncharacterized protein n=1 Tax=Methylobacterium oxalidis TaxID=944322 RepID=A0A512J7L6_9HYPH|nr:hypothetical protein [Methylobacterium oxalidis]GEP05961.1 hypothetical protein MOX02_39990 [Methylobacterium oxalidis]GJE35574.1 hypothetical protein LDDCCGHA_5793 [Methylobacterium oxalidis]GLS66954.1 hypothetical protein GCM10007888_53370 [Methylobacterium oxalidis]
MPRRATVLFPLAAFLLAAAPAEAVQPGSCRPTLAEYRALALGIGYADASAQLGCRGRREVALTVGRNRRVTYSWRGRGSFGANFNLTFANDRLTDKSQLGLR